MVPCPLRKKGFPSSSNGDSSQAATDLRFWESLHHASVGSSMQLSESMASRHTDSKEVPAIAVFTAASELKKDEAFGGLISQILCSFPADDRR
jgi:hypothetical protein